MKITRRQLKKLISETVLLEAKTGKNYTNAKRIKNPDDLKDFFKASVVEQLKPKGELAFVAYVADADGEVGLNELRELAVNEFQKENPEKDYMSKVKIPQHVLVYEDK